VLQKSWSGEQHEKGEESNYRFEVLFHADEPYYVRREVDHVYSLGAMQAQGNCNTLATTPVAAASWNSSV